MLPRNTMQSWCEMFAHRTSGAERALLIGQFASLKLVCAALMFGAFSQTAAAQTPTDTAAKTPAEDALQAGAASVAPVSALPQVVLSTDKTQLPADGRSVFRVIVELKGGDGQPLKGEQWALVYAGGAKVRPAKDVVSEIDLINESQRMIGQNLQVKLVDGKAMIDVVAPAMPQNFDLVVQSNGSRATLPLKVTQVHSKMLTSGLIEGIVGFRQSGKSIPDSEFTGVGDGFEEEIVRWSRWNADRTVGTAARAAIYMNGNVSTNTVLTLAYDSDKDKTRKLQTELDPDQWYSIYGDASTVTKPNLSDDYLYLRLGRFDDFLLYGNYDTGAGFASTSGAGAVASLKGRELGNYNRTLTGVRGHVEGKRGHFNVFAARDNLKQVVREIPAIGMSGPYKVPDAIDALALTEKVEIITRARDNVGVVVNVRPLSRSNDYIFDPTNQTILFKQPISSVDAALNPVYIRVSFEIENGAQKEWLYGLDGEVNITPNWMLGGSFVTDKNPNSPYRLGSIHTKVGIHKNFALVLEAAQSKSLASERSAADGSLASYSLTPDKGYAYRVTGLYTGEKLKVNALAAKSDDTFYNPSSSFSMGRRELAFDANYQHDALTQLFTRANNTENAITTASSRSWQLGINRQISPKWKMDVFYEGSRQTSGTSSVQSTTSLTSTPNNPWANSTAGETLGFNAFGLGAQYQHSKDTSFTGSYAVDAGSFDNFGRLRLGVETQLTSLLKSYARYEGVHGLDTVSQTALEQDRTEAHAIVAGVEYRPKTPVKGLDITTFAENRVRENSTGQENQLATGVKTNWVLADNLDLNLGVEHLTVYQGLDRDISNANIGFNWKATEKSNLAGQLEVRREHGRDAYSYTRKDSSGNSIVTNVAELIARDSVLGRINYALSLNDEWSILTSNTAQYSRLVDGSARSNDYQSKWGLAYRSADTNKINALAKLTYRTKRDTTQSSTLQDVTDGYDKTIGSLLFDYRPSRAWIMSTRLAYKHQTDVLASGNTEEWSAGLLSGRVFYEFAEKWGIGVHAYVLKGLSASDRGVYENAGMELGYNAFKNIWLSAGYNFRGFDAPDLVGSSYTNKGAYVRMRYKLPQDLFAND